MTRNLFDELSEGFTALKSERKGKITLKQHKVEKTKTYHYARRINTPT